MAKRTKQQKSLTGDNVVLEGPCFIYDLSAYRIDKRSAYLITSRYIQSKKEIPIKNKYDKKNKVLLTMSLLYAPKEFINHERVF